MSDQFVLFWTVTGLGAVIGKDADRPRLRMFNRALAFVAWAVLLGMWIYRELGTR